MKCPFCQTENLATRKFCRECGGKLLVVCPECKAENAPGDKFCGECGRPVDSARAPVVKEMTFDEKLSKIKKYLPEGLTEKILSQRDRIEGEKKQVTVMFCDMEGFTSISEKIGPEGVYALMDQVYEVLIHKVNDFGGTVNELTGDGIMALFGAPAAVEDATHRAIRSALSIQKEMTRFSERLSAEKGSPAIRMRIGIHSGPVVVGTVGNDLRVDFKAVGDTVNVASRVQSLAEPGTTFVTEETFRLTEGLFRFENLGERQVKGKKKPIRIYQVLAPSSRRTRFDVSAERGLSPFISRERELEILLDAFQRVKDGRGQAVSIVSEPGMGKSRLLFEFRKCVANENVTFLEGKCISFNKNTAYHPVIDALKSNFDIQDTDRKKKINRKVRYGLYAIKENDPSRHNLIVNLLSGDEKGCSQSAKDPEEARYRIIETLKQIVLMGSKQRPLIIAFEDLHWVDRSSENVFNLLIEEIAGLKVLLIFTFRHGFIHQWHQKSYHTLITLNPLSNRKRLEMATHLFGSEVLPADVENIIIDKSEGIPFFIEELIKHLPRANGMQCNQFQMDAYGEDLTIPATIREIIMVRVDALPELSKKIIQTASVIEKEFPYDLIRHVTGLPDQELLTELEELKRRELLYQRNDSNSKTFIFNHALTRDILYASLLENKKRRLHSEIADSIETLYADHLLDHSEQLAAHYLCGQNFEKAAFYCHRSVRRAWQKGSYYDAIFFARKRVMCIEKRMPVIQSSQDLIEARVSLGMLYAAINYMSDARQAVFPVADLAKELNLKGLLGYIYIVLGAYALFVEENFETTFKLLSDAAFIARQTQKLTLLHSAGIWLGIANAWHAEFEESRLQFKTAIETGSSPGQIALAKAHLAWGGYVSNKDTQTGVQITSEAVKLMQNTQSGYYEGWIYTFQGWCNYIYGSFELSEEILLKAIQSCKQANLLSIRAIANYIIGLIAYHGNQYATSKEYLKEAITLFDKAGVWPSYKDDCEIALNRLMIMNDEKELNLDRLEFLCRRNKVNLLEGTKARRISDILIKMGNCHINEAESWIAKAVEADQRYETIWSLGRDYMTWGKLHSIKEDKKESKSCYDKAIEIMLVCGANGWIDKIRALSV
jgi:class 3 adenylate cyclase/tetratricopeptide (TPR) repeat protein